MKELQFSTSKGEFLLLDGKDTITERLTELLKEYEHYAVVKEMTEEQFAEVVDKLEWSDGYFMYYRYDKSVHDFAKTWTAKDSFLSLVLSLGWYLWENPVETPHNLGLIDTYPTGSLLTDKNLDAALNWQEAESKTLYSPILLKKI